MSVISKDQNMRPALNETIDYLNEHDFHGEITTETNARTSADTELGILIQNEQTARSEQFDNLQAAIDTETTQRESTDESFQNTLTGFNTTLTAHQTTLDNITANVTLNLSQVIDGTYFLPLSGGILEYSPLLGVVLFGGMSLSVVTPCDHNTVVGTITDSRFKPKHDIILCEFITNTLSQPKRIYFVLSAAGSIYCRYYASGQSITAGSTYRSTSNIWLAS